MNYIWQHPAEILQLLERHLYMTGISLAVATLIALPLGWLIAPRDRLSAVVLSALGIVYTIPSLALIILLLPVFGLNPTAIIIALVVYAQIILVRNVVAGLKAVNPVILEAARGMGMNSWQRWWRVQFPLALPVILAGVRIAAVAVIAIATIGAMFGAGGLGTLLFVGVAEGRAEKIIAGAISVSLLALVVNWGLRVLESRLAARPR